MVGGRQGSSTPHPKDATMRADSNVNNIDPPRHPAKTPKHSEHRLKAVLYLLVSMAHFNRDIVIAGAYFGVAAIELSKRS